MIPYNNQVIYMCIGRYTCTCRGTRGFGNTWHTTCDHLTNQCVYLSVTSANLALRVEIRFYGNQSRQWDVNSRTLASICVQRKPGSLADHRGQLNRCVCECVLNCLRRQIRSYLHIGRHCDVIMHLHARNF